MSIGSISMSKKAAIAKKTSKAMGSNYSYKNLIEINSELLEIAFDNLSSFETSDISVYVMLYFVYPLIFSWLMTWFNVVFVASFLVLFL